ncbi:acyl-coenzyme A thioesterase 1-like [Eriocheir sinensis]|uniref:acyl-coenzyme A thioesterase 1-like n=1 Tax=Eriocheir sinensis TaxID=95602 RepID=UPI0021C81E96|nr:acyl-coenzyme A thioesterase 1-like [Eriocheir sinensis]
MADLGSERDGRSSRVKVEVTPRVCLHDVPTSINVSGLTPKKNVTLTLTTHNDSGHKFHTFAQYVSDESGRVDVEESEAVGGAYTGVFPAGLFSTLTEYPFKYTRLQKEDCTSPWKMTLLVHEGHLTLEESTVSNGIASALLERHIMGPGVRRVPVTHERVRGTVFFPAGSGPHPAIVDIFGGFGGLKEYRASMLASRGFACLAIAYFNYDDLPKILTTMDLEYFEEAVEYLLKQPDVIPDRCGVLSSSKGGSFGLAMGIHLAKVTAVVSIGGMLVGDTSTTYQGKELWKGVTLDATLYDLDEQNMITIKENALKKKVTYDHPSMPPIETAPENTHFLLISGEEDGMRSKVPLEAITHRMRLYGREGKCHTVVYSGAGHIIEPPYNTFSGYSIYDLTGQKIIMIWGGEPQGVCKAQVDNWQNMRKFLEMHVRDRSPWYEQYVGMASGKGKF